MLNENGELRSDFPSVSKVLKEFYDSPAPGVVDQLKDQIFPMIMDALTQEAEQNNHAPFDGLDESLKATTIDQVFYLLREAMKQSMGLPNDKEKEGEEEDMEEPMDDMPGFEGTMDALNSLSIRKNNDDMMNESKQLIKNNFKRFL